MELASTIVITIALLVFLVSFVIAQTKLVNKLNKMDENRIQTKIFW